MARELRAVTPDGHVWFVRRRWARRRRPWARPDRHQARFASAEELPSEDEKLILPDLVGLFETFPKDGDPPPSHYEARRRYAARMGAALLAGFLATGLLISAFIEFVVPRLAPLLAANVRPLAAVAAGVVTLVAVDRLQRPWLVELQRQGLADAPRRVWRVRGRRRSNRLMDEIAEAVRQGRTDAEHGVLLSPRASRLVR